MQYQNFVHVFLVLLIICSRISRSKKSKEKPSWANKNIMDFDDADMERLLDQWEEDDEPLPYDELPEHKRPPAAQPNIDLSKIGSLSPDELMKMTKKGKTLMMFVNIDGNPSKQEGETLSSVWQGALRNNHIQCERYAIDDARAIFLFQDGAQAWDAKDYLIQQDRVKDVTLEGQTHVGKKSKSDSTKSEL